MDGILLVRAVYFMGIFQYTHLLFPPEPSEADRQDEKNTTTTPADVAKTGAADVVEQVGTIALALMSSVPMLDLLPD